MASGDHFDIECAVRADLSSPVKTFLDEMKSGSWEPVQEGASAIDEEEHLEPDEQVECYSWFVKACKRIATKGTPIHGQSYNQLQNGIWEIKHWDLRISFFDTDGTGQYEPLIDYDSYKGTRKTRPWPENFEEYLRLTTAFPKSQQEVHIEKSQEVREEDLEHDRNQDSSAVTS